MEVAQLCFCASNGGLSSGPQHTHTNNPSSAEAEIAVPLELSGQPVWLSLCATV